MTVIKLTDSMAALRERIALATSAAGRPGANVTIVAVSKTHPADAVRAARDAGLTDFGENYVQEALAKITAVGPGATWHFIGGIQANKTRAIAENFQWAQTVTSAQIAGRLSRQRPYHGSELQVCLQLRPKATETRGGVPGDELPALAEQVSALPRLKLRGLMFMPLPGLNEQELRAEFCRARRLFDDLRRRGHDIDTLSMGMSEDLEIAIAEGSTMVRVGTALFGARS
jgi:pyridoxal phosphate enzyme (YggS family)